MTRFFDPEAASTCPPDRAIAAVGASVLCREAPDARGWRDLDTLAEPCSFDLTGRCCHHVAARLLSVARPSVSNRLICDVDAA